jgi:hypothetical protein
MTRSIDRTAAVCAVFSVFLIQISCSSTSTAPQQGTPAFYWSAAKETYAAGDYQKTVEHLDRIIGTENEYTARALPWYLVMTSGMARGYAYLADSYEGGARTNKTDPTTFRRQLNMYRSAAGRTAVQFAEAFATYQKRKDETVPLAFPYPTGSAGAVPALVRAANGMLPSQQEMETAQRRAVERGVLLQTCNAVGAPEDSAKAQEAFKGSASVPRAVFVTAMADALYDGSQLFSRSKLDDPEKFKILCGRAREAINAIPATKQTKELNSKIDSALKKAKVS